MNSQTKDIETETILCKQSIVTIPKLHLIEILEFEEDKSRGKTLTSLVLTKGRVRSKKESYSPITNLVTTKYCFGLDSTLTRRGILWSVRL